MNALRHAVDRILGWTIALLTAVMVINVLWQVFTRFVLGTPSSFTEEAARYMMVWVGLLGAAYASGQKAHLSLDLITAHLQGAKKRASDLFVNSVVLLFALGAMVGGGGRLVWIQLSLGQQSAALQVKLGYVYLVVPLAGMLIAFYSVLALREAIRRPPSGAPTEEGEGQR